MVHTKLRQTHRFYYTNYDDSGCARASNYARIHTDDVYMISNIVNRGNHTMALDFDARCMLAFSSYVLLSLAHSRAFLLLLSYSSHFWLCWLFFVVVVSTYKHKHTGTHISMGANCHHAAYVSIYLYHIWYLYMFIFLDVCIYICVSECSFWVYQRTVSLPLASPRWISHTLHGIYR